MQIEQVINQISTTKKLKDNLAANTSVIMQVEYQIHPKKIVLFQIEYFPYHKEIIIKAFIRKQVITKVNLPKEQIFQRII